MKAFVAVLALVAAVAGDGSIQQPNSHLQPPVKQHSSKDFNAPWVEENAWRPTADPHQPIHVPQENSYYTQVQHGNYNQDYQQDAHQYQPHQQIGVLQQSSYYAPEQHGIKNQDYQQQYYHHKEHQQQQQGGHYQINNAPSSVAGQDYQQQYYNHQGHHQQQQGHYQTNNAPSSVAVQVTHPDWATSFSNVNRYNTYWPSAPAAPVMVAPVPYVTAAPVFAAPAPFTKPTQAPVAVYNNNVAKWNPWSNTKTQYSHHHQHQQLPSRDITRVPHSVAKYVAITPGSIHIAPLPGHTVSHKFLNMAPAGSW